MLRRGWVVGLAAGVLLMAGGTSQAASFGPGEQMVIKVEFLGIRAGTATITVGSNVKQGARDTWPLVVTADTQALFSIYPLHDKFVSWWDPAMGRSVAYDFYALEAGKPRDERARFGIPQEGKVQILRSQPGQSATTSVYDCTALDQDIAGAFFSVRNLDLQPGRDFNIPTFSGRHSWVMEVHVNPPEPLTVQAGQFSALPLDIAVHFDGKLETKRRIKMWVSADDRKVILKSQADLVLGSLNAELMEYHPGNTPHFGIQADSGAGSGSN